jgi:RNA 2',3'-cyclic 3'-phosphodiesterase
MIRLFTAIQLPEEQKLSLLSRMAGLPKVRWQTEDQLHLTLRFIGEVEETRVEEIRFLLSEITFKPFSIWLSGVGKFGSQRKARMVWAGVEGANNLKALQEKITNVLRRAGIPPDERKYTPHITLGRLKGNNGPKLQEFIENNRDLFLPGFEVTQFHLMQSLLGNTGAHYQVIETYPARD